jgi:hypothetical protein
MDPRFGRNTFRNNVYPRCLDETAKNYNFVITIKNYKITILQLQNYNIAITKLQYCYY